MPIIDAHVHFAGDEPESLVLLQDLDIKLLNICVALDPGDGWREQADTWGALVAEYPAHYAWCTSFDLPQIGNPNYADDVIASVERDFANGAVACKVWKNIGMDVRDASGAFMMVDDPLLEPIFSALEVHGKPLLMHIGEPLACWQSLEEMGPDHPHFPYYSTHPEWHMYGKPDVPSHADHIAARDRVVERHPKLSIIGAHLGSLEYDVGEIAKRFEQYPNFAVDTSARLEDLVRQDADRVRDFFMTYADRILFGTDLVCFSRTSQTPPAERTAVCEEMRRQVSYNLAYFSTSGKFVMGNREFDGLALPAAIIDKVMGENARRWYPGL